MASSKEATVADPGNATAWRKRGDLLLGFGPAIRGRGCPLQGAGAGGEGIISVFFFKFYGAKELKVSELRNRYPTVGFWRPRLPAGCLGRIPGHGIGRGKVRGKLIGKLAREGTHWADGSLEEALEAYDKSLLIDPENGDVWLGKALILDILQHKRVSGSL